MTPIDLRKGYDYNAMIAGTPTPRLQSALWIRVSARVTYSTPVLLAASV